MTQTLSSFELKYSCKLEKPPFKELIWFKYSPKRAIRVNTIERPVFQSLEVALIILFSSFLSMTLSKLIEIAFFCVEFIK